MVSTFKLLPMAMLLCFLAPNIATARILDPRPTLLARLKLDEEEGSSRPILGRAIKVIERDCWPAMLGSLGYTTEEGDILRGYCDASDSESTGSNTPLSPP
ncbi:hypothetical protein BUALT_Bualt04G0010800 [Buddleja alternifolia]|uniref:Uncharacterized protein n=1 Tax=Buddleja alternifolia TaxID=168488 RepID=A0AAV6XSX8_9LAMI|nr:hypothetical protein BUALT_Bualt04G0010800 [Buddleja alternifolia]